MAQFFPTRTTCRFDPPGERRLAERLEKKLEDDYLCWFNIPERAKALQSNLVLMHPSRGLLVLEVKDWKLETIQSMDRDKAKIYADGLPKSQKNPMLQARAYGARSPNCCVSSPISRNTTALWSASATSKGLEFGLVPIPSLGDMPKKGKDEADEARLLYAAMTRAIDWLVMTYREPSSFTRRIQDSIGSVRQHLAEVDSQRAAS